MLSSARYEKATFPFHLECQEGWSQIYPHAASTQVNAIRGGLTGPHHNHLEAGVSNAGAGVHAARPRTNTQIPRLMHAHFRNHWYAIVL